jgi:hypothetical protein
MSMCLTYQEGEQKESGRDEGGMHLEDSNRGRVGVAITVVTAATVVEP